MRTRSFSQIEDQIQDILHLSRQLVRKSNNIAKKVDDNRITPAMYGLMVLVRECGQVTVPTLARVMGTGRQHVQRLVNGLLAAGMVMREVNPAHRRSWLVSLSDRGRALIERSVEDEQAFAARFANEWRVEDLQTCHKVLQQLLAGLAGKEVSGKLQDIETRHNTSTKGVVDGAVCEPFTLRTPVDCVKAEEEAEEDDTLCSTAIEKSSSSLTPSPQPLTNLNWNGGNGLQMD